MDARLATTQTISTTPPRNLHELDLPQGLVNDLILRLLLIESRSSTYHLSEHLALSPVLMTSLIEELRDLRLIEVLGMQGADYKIALTDEGHRQAVERMQLCRYSGPAPVSLDAYRQIVRAQHASPIFNMDGLREAFSDLVIYDELLAELGPAVMGAGAMFLYGPPGTGKSSIAERLGRVSHDYVLVPWAVEVDSQIVLVFDPIVHRPAPEQPAGLDPRWVLCERPVITVGGELTGSALDLSYQRGSGIYLAPLQMQANNGVLVIDDFGRQVLTPEELLNRWIVPLDRGVDYLSLEYGTKFDIPFDLKIVFSTNLEPESLGDEAFFRRIQSKVLVQPIADDHFDEVLARVAKEKGVAVSPDAPEHLRWITREMGDGDLRPYLPKVVIELLEAVCKFEERPVELDRAMVDRIGHMYFTRSTLDAAARSSRRFAAQDAPPAPAPGFEVQGEPGAF